MSDLSTLRQTVSSLDGPLFAVLDGARFENLTDTLQRADLRHRCLYLDRGDNNPERLVTAPHMVGPLDGGTTATVMDLLDEGGSAAGVFWACEAGADTLFRHLRRINMFGFLMAKPWGGMAAPMSGGTAPITLRRSLSSSAMPTPT